MRPSGGCRLFTARRPTLKTSAMPALSGACVHFVHRPGKARMHNKFRKQVLAPLLKRVITKFKVRKEPADLQEVLEEPMYASSNLGRAHVFQDALWLQGTNV